MFACWKIGEEKLKKFQKKLKKLLSVSEETEKETDILGVCPGY